ncbi:hypothetical protein [Rhodococcus sp. BE178]|uniref:hypothetical protein n=1 Tax=Rhodococcus sp. BE178 TaxID=2817737 RepID=UPI003D252B74
MAHRLYVVKAWKLTERSARDLSLAAAARDLAELSVSESSSSPATRTTKTTA